MPQYTITYRYSLHGKPLLGFKVVTAATRVDAHKLIAAFHPSVDGIAILTTRENTVPLATITARD